MSEQQSGLRSWLGVLVALVAAGGGVVGWRTVLRGQAEASSAKQNFTESVSGKRAPVIEHFGLASSGEQDGAKRIEWRVRGASSVSITPDIGAVAVTGSREVQPSATTTYRLTASNADGTSTADCTVDVHGPTPLTLQATVYPPSVGVGDKATIYVTVLDPARLPVSNAKVIIESGGGRFLPSADTQYDRNDKLHGPFSTAGTTKDNGQFTAWWVCNPCAGGYQMTVRANKDGHVEASTNIDVKVN